MALALLAGSMTANAQTTTFAFTGVVTNSSVGGISAGHYVTGTYTFNYNSADQIIGILGGLNIAPWVIGSSGVPYNPVFASMVKIGTFIYQSSTTAPAIDPDDASMVTGNFSTLSASEATPAFDLGSYFAIVENGTSSGFPYTGQGYPVTLSTNQSASGRFLYGLASVSYEITSLTLAPAPPPATLLATLLTEATGVGPGDSLADKVERAQTDYAAGEVQRTCHVLAEFLHEVQRQDGRTIAPPLDANLTKQAQAIAATIGCN
jgi:hypothetical protein